MFLINPFFLFFMPWVVATLLYLIFPIPLILTSYNFLLAALIFMAFIVGYAFTAFIKKKNNDYSGKMRIRVVYFFFLIWLLGTLAEIYFASGLPLIWLYQNSDKTYFDFGIPSLHGLLNSLSLTLICFFVVDIFEQSKWRSLNLAFIFAIISMYILFISRQLIVSAVIESFVIVIYLCSRKKIFRYRHVFYVALSSLVVIVGFGVIGDARSSDFYQTIGLNDVNPLIPSGFIWFYIYMVTPLNNLFYNVSYDSYLLVENASAFFYSILPTVVKVAMFDVDVENRWAQDFLQTGLLPNTSFNVSTALIQAYLDAGLYGIWLNVASLGFLAGIFYKRISNIFSLMIYAVVGQCLLLSIFYNMIIYPPVLFQFVWIYIFYNAGVMCKRC
ncbi:O-antigen polymerase [Limnohabitans sp. TEGF004]|uniref:O-antigen polymerase n=1 Tax=Limnohabitans sp. TEGF004 TaxID=2986281 RepID=UPI002491ED7D|nr:O-antigen polymerase [Limnohabitans sp. TEGF004]